MTEADRRKLDSARLLAAATRDEVGKDPRAWLHGLVVETDALCKAGERWKGHQEALENVRTLARHLRDRYGIHPATEAARFGAVADGVEGMLQAKLARVWRENRNPEPLSEAFERLSLAGFVAILGFLGYQFLS